MKYFLFVVILSSLVLAQEHSKSVSIKLLGGLNISTSSEFNKYYPGNRFCFGAGFTVPVTSSFSIVAKGLISNGEKNINIPEDLYNRGYFSNGTQEINEISLNLGGEQKFFLSEDFTLLVNGGVTYAIIDENFQSSIIDLGRESNVDGWGLWLGSGIEKSFGKSPLSLTAEVQYNVLDFMDNYRSFSYNSLSSMLGVRFYFAERRME